MSKHEEKKADLNAKESDCKKDNTVENPEETETPESEELRALKEENQKLKDSFLRAYAEAENTKKRCAQEIEKNSKFAISSFAKELLGVADNLGRALQAVDDNTSAECKALMQGVEMTQNELTKVFAKFGIKKIDCMGQVFDPNFEQVVQEIEDNEKPAGTIVSELQSGYMIHDRILREAMVIVTKQTK